MKPLRSCLLALSGISAFACGSNPSSKSEQSSDPTDPQTTLADLVAIDQIAVYQGVKVTLLEDAAPTKPNAPVIPGRPAMIRVHARKVTSTTKVSMLAAELRIHAKDHEDVVITDSARNLVPLEEGELSTTFHFDVAAEAILPGATLSVTLHDPNGGDEAVIHGPVEGTLPMNVGPLAPKLKVRLVPIKYDADGSGRVPPLEKKTVDEYRTALHSMYPVSDIEMSVREPFNWPVTVDAGGDGWDDLLAAVMETREDDKVEDDIYYVGVFNPADTERQYCNSGCVLGIAPMAEVLDIGLRVALIVGYPGERADGTLAQELAHAMGRLHAPCQVDVAVDDKYPYTRASVGVWGWDLAQQKLVDPESRVFDFMSYCSPVWVSDYTFAGLYQRMLEVEKRKNFHPHRPTKVYHVQADGSLRAGPTVSVLDPLAGAETIALEGDQGHLGTVRAAFRPTGTRGQGLLLAPPDTDADIFARAKFMRRVETR